MRARVRVQVGFSDVREHSCQGVDVLELFEVLQISRGLQTDGESDVPQRILPSSTLY